MERERREARVGALGGGQHTAVGGQVGRARRGRQRQVHAAVVPRVLRDVRGAQALAERVRALDGGVVALTCAAGVPAGRELCRDPVGRRRGAGVPGRVGRGGGDQQDVRACDAGAQRAVVDGGVAVGGRGHGDGAGAAERGVVPQLALGMV